MKFADLRDLLINKTKHMACFNSQDPDSNIDLNIISYFINEAVISITNKIKLNPFSKYSEFYLIGNNDLSEVKKQSTVIAAQTVIAQKGLSNELMAEVMSFNRIDSDTTQLGSEAIFEKNWYLVIREI